MNSLCSERRFWTARAILGLASGVLIVVSASACCTQQCMRCLVGCYDTVDDGRNVAPTGMSTASHLDGKDGIGMAH